MPLKEQMLLGKLDLAAAQLRKQDVASVDELLEVFAHPLLAAAELEPHIANFLKSYAQAELAGKEQADEFVKKVYSKISDEAVRIPLTGSDLTLANLVLLTRYAVHNKGWTFGRKKNPNFNSLPLAV